MTPDRRVEDAWQAVVAARDALTAQARRVAGFHRAKHTLDRELHELSLADQRYARAFTAYTEAVRAARIEVPV